MSKIACLEARILWKSPRWFPLLKWPSAEEVDFGDFRTIFDFEENLVYLRYTDGRHQTVGSFPQQLKGAKISSLVGEIDTARYIIQNRASQLESSDGTVDLIITSRSDGRTFEMETLEEEGKNPVFRYMDQLVITPKVVRPDSCLQLKYTQDAFVLAVISASFLMFQRFDQEASPEAELELQNSAP